MGNNLDLSSSGGELFKPDSRTQRERWVFKVKILSRLIILYGLYKGEILGTGKNKKEGKLGAHAVKHLLHYLCLLLLSDEGRQVKPVLIPSDLLNLFNGNWYRLASRKR